MSQRLKLWWARRRLRRAFVSYTHVRDNYNCGQAIAASTSRRYRAAVRRFNAALHQVKALDPDCVLKEIK